jgi:hypothetical protein
MKKFVLTVVVGALVAALACVAAWFAAPSGEAQASASRACGVERWTVKTLQDRPRVGFANSSAVPWSCRGSLG